MAGCPFALNSDEARADLEDHVVATAFSHRLVNVDAELDCRSDNRSLCDVALLICREHVVERSNGPGWAMAGLDNLRVPTGTRNVDACPCGPDLSQPRRFYLQQPSSCRTVLRRSPRTTRILSALPACSTPT